MVDPGTGVSPLIAFLQYREALLKQDKTLGEAALYFGCRNQNDFNLPTKIQRLAIARSTSSDISSLLLPARTSQNLRTEINTAKSSTRMANVESSPMSLLCLR